MSDNDLLELAAQTENERESLKAQLDEMRRIFTEMLKADCNGLEIIYTGSEDQHYFRCVLCGENNYMIPFPHSPTCPMENLRDYLTDDPAR